MAAGAKPIKVYVKVKVVFGEDGKMRPRALEWEDGCIYKIEKIKDVKQAAAMR